MDESTRAQDVFAELVMQCRLGTVRQMRLRDNPKRTEYSMFKPEVDLNIPVFYDSELPTHLDRTHAAGFQAVKEGRLRLPYPRCGFLSRMGRDHLGLTQAPERFRTNTGRYYFALVEEDGSDIMVNSFVRHDKHKHWSAQIWQARLTPSNLEIAYDPDACSGAGPEFMAFLDQSNVNRITVLLATILKITTGQGVMTPAADGPVTGRVNRAQARSGFPQVSRVRVLRFDPAPPGPPRTIASGTAKAPHFRRGTWRTLQSGKAIWVRPAAVHGGSGDVPPWYELRAAQSPPA